MFRHAKKVFYTLLLASPLYSCSEDAEFKDVKAPVITLVSPAEEAVFSPGDTIHVEAVLEDETGLATWQVTIHENSDGHSHGRLKAAEFAFEKSFDVSGKRVEVSEKIAIPADAETGHYHFIVKAIDQLGNATSFADGSTVEREIEIAEKLEE